MRNSGRENGFMEQIHSREAEEARLSVCGGKENMLEIGAASG